MAARSVTITFQNETDTTLTKLSEHLDHGEWDVHPPQVIGPHAVVSWKSESNGFMTGTQGSAAYQMANRPGQVQVSWDNPYVGSNSYRQSAPQGFTIGESGGSGDDAQVAFTLRPDVVPAIPSLPINSLAVRVITSTESLAGTDNDVYFDVGPLAWKLDKSGYNDFERGADDTYPLDLHGLALRTDDLVWLRLWKKGMLGYSGTGDGLDGAWKPAAVHLVVNGRELVGADINQWLTDSNPQWMHLLRPGLAPEELFARTLRVLPNEPIGAFSESVAILTTNAFKLRGISGWLGTDLIACAYGTVIRPPAKSTDGLATIDLRLESVELNGRRFVLDGAHGINLDRYLRVEYMYGGFPPLPMGNPVPGDGQTVRICGNVKWDTDHEGWYEIHPRSPRDVEIVRQSPIDIRHPADIEVRGGRPPRLPDK